MSSLLMDWNAGVSLPLDGKSKMQNHAVPCSAMQCPVYVRTSIDSTRKGGEHILPKGTYKNMQKWF